MRRVRNPKVRKVFCEIVEGAVYEDRCLFKLSQVVEGSPIYKECILQELETLKRKQRISPKKKRGSRKSRRAKDQKRLEKDQGFYDSQEVSELLNIPLRTIQGWAKRGKIPSKKTKSKWIFPKEEIDRLVKERKKSNGSSLDQSSRIVDNGRCSEISESLKDDHLSTVEKTGDPGAEDREPMAFPKR